MAILTEGFNSFGSSFAPSDLPNVEEYSSDNHGDIRAIQEAYEDMVGVVEAIASYDFHDLKMRSESERSEVALESLYPVYESGFVDKAKEIFNKIKKFLMDLWAKLKQFFKTAIASILAIFMKGKDFVKKYKSDLDAHKSKTVELQSAYKYSNLDKKPDMKPDGSYLEKLKKVAEEAAKFKYDSDGGHDRTESETRADGERKELGEAIKGLRAAASDIKDNKDDKLDAHRGSLLGQGSISSSQFDDKIFAYFRSGKNDPSQVKWAVSEAMEILESDYTKVAKEAESDMNDLFSKALDAIKKFEDFTGKASKGTKELIINAAKESSSFITAVQSINQTFFRKQKDAIFSAEITAKRVCVKAIGGKADKE